MKLIQVLFKYLIVDGCVREPWLKGWATNYAAILRRTGEVKEKVAQPDMQVLSKEVLGEKEYRDFMHSWLKKKVNGVSSQGQSTLSEKDFIRVIDDDTFVKLFSDFLLNPTPEHYLKIRDNWKEYVGKDNKVLYNRAAAAVNSELTCVVDEQKFYAALHYFRKEEFGYHQKITGNWFQDNVNLTRWLDQELKAESESILEQIKPDRGLNSEEQGFWWAVWRNIFVWEIYVSRPGMFDLKKNIVMYGAPGTGKTYSCKSDAVNHFGFWKAFYRPDYKKEVTAHTETVQFHPSFTYEDFMEGIKPVPTEDGKTQLKLVNGIFKAFCKKAAAWEMEVYKAFPDRNWNKQPLDTLRIREVGQEKLTGERWSFLEGLTDDDDEKPKFLHEYIPPHYLIIDEINRAELSRVMGELMLCLEYRGLAGKIKTQYSYLSQTGTDTEYWREADSNYFFVPHNVYILATMNTIDRSVESFDFALRRRFRWIEVQPNYDALLDYLYNKEMDEGSVEALIDGLRQLNKQIGQNPLLGKDFQIGHAYFMNLPDLFYRMKLKDLRGELWSNFIQPLLEEYLRGTGDMANTISGFKGAFETKGNG